MNFSDHIKTTREKLNLSQERFGKKIGVSGKTISAYETGRAQPSASVMVKLSKEFGILLVGAKSLDRDTVVQKIRDLEDKLYELRNQFFQS